MAQISEELTGNSNLRIDGSLAALSLQLSTADVHGLIKTPTARTGKINKRSLLEETGINSSRREVIDTSINDQHIAKPVRKWRRAGGTRDGRGQTRTELIECSRNSIPSPESINFGGG